MQTLQIETTIADLYTDSNNDQYRLSKMSAIGNFQSLQPSDFEDLYLAITKEQGLDLVELIKANKLKKVVEFGTSFGISTLFLAQGIIETGGSILTTELIESKAQKAKSNFKRANVNDIIEIRVGDAMKTLENYDEPIDLLLLDGWKDLYLPLFQMLEPNFHLNTIIYVDNADVNECRLLLNFIKQDLSYSLQYMHHGKAALVKKVEE